MSACDQRLIDHRRGKVNWWATKTLLQLACRVFSCILYVSIGALSCLGESESESQTARFSPARYVRIFEDTGTKRILLYEPKQQGQGEQEREGLNSSQMTVDGRSTILIEVAPDLMDGHVSMNRLFMSASLSRRNGEAANDPVVVGYSEVGKAQDAAESQQAVSLQTGANVQRTLINMLFTIEDLIKTFYDDDCAKELAENPRDSCGGKDPDKELIESKFRLYTPEITAIANFFLAKDTARVAGLLGSEAFDIDFDSLVAIMRQYKDDTAALFDAGASDDKKKAARKDLVERTKLFWFDFSYIRDEIDVEEYRLTAALNKKAIQKNEIPACFTKDDFDYLKTRYDIISDLIKDPNTSKDSINDLNSKLEKVLYAEAIKSEFPIWNSDSNMVLPLFS